MVCTVSPWCTAVSHIVDHMVAKAAILHGANVKGHVVNIMRRLATVLTHPPRTTT